MKTMLLLCLCFFTASIFGQETCLQNSWTAYNAKKWKAAIQHATECTSEFGAEARKKQRELASQNYKLPTNYTVPEGLPPQQKQEIFSHGLLNDVAVSYWIIGMANLRLNKPTAAKQAFKKAAELTYGLCYDHAKKLFWCPSEKAKVQLEELK